MPAARTGRPARLSRSGILTAARSILERDGVAALTMRRLAREVGSTPMALYHHVEDREQLLVLLLDDYAAGIPVPEVDGAPRERIVVAATTMHTALAARPWITEVLTADTVMSASALWYPEQIISAAVDAGLTAEQGVVVYRSIWHFTAGDILVRHNAAQAKGKAPASPREQLIAAADPAQLPRIAELASRWATLTAQDMYLDGLNAMVDGFLASCGARTGR
ncbi:TetR/AcrR family transcriptional regulator [Pseudonocardia alni]|uniref:TetR/AcrR family transcriptional regulator n=1 Tax=Pseudonocardia alni TaxID=33907 RepID=UPI00280AB77C|nr:TetR/AcrR family transcriptional regulator C-terminal domain-containing protein [Pseudonocardia alni]